MARASLAGAILLGVILTGMIPLGADIANANEAPRLDYLELVLDPADATLEPCGSRTSLNDLDNLNALAVRAQHYLSLRVRAVDPDGDQIELQVADLPLPMADFTAITYTDDHREALIEVFAPAGVNSEELCEQVGTVTLSAREVASEQLVTSEAIPFFVKCDCPDLEAEIYDPPVEGFLGEPVRITGRVRCHDFNAGTFTATVWLEDPNGSTVTSRTATYPNLAAGRSVNIPQVMYVPEMAGQYCARMTVTSVDDIVTANNETEYCFLVNSGSFEVLPNVATPNGDGRNDAVLFLLANQSIAAPRLRIFSLGGQLLFESTTPDREQRLAWIGRDRDGRQVPAGSYLYVVYDGETAFHTGICGVIR